MELNDIKKSFLNKITNHNDFHMDFHLIASHVLGIATSELTPFIEVDKARERKIRKMLNRHIKGEPVQKILGSSVFYDCYIQYSNKTLTPRVDTELLVEKAIDCIGNQELKVLDMCAGSGCIGIAIAKHTNAKVICADVSKYAIKECKQNAMCNNVKIETIKSDLFANIKEKFDLIVCNPPYIPAYEYDKLEQIVKKYDPKLALVAENNGLAIYQKLAIEAVKYLNSNGILLMEIGFNQGKVVADFMKQTFKEVQLIKDYGNRDRIILAKN